MTATTPRSLSAIAREIKKDWGDRAYFGAVPYIEAMLEMRSASENFGDDSGREIVLRFLGNSRNWRGEKAKAIKAELKQMIGLK